jgi:heme/copper-type cytochrome/quinol oxidase subunit 1
LAAVLGSGDHKVIGRLYLGFGLLLGTAVLVLGGLFALESVTPKNADIFTDDTIFQFFTMYRLGTVFLLALPLVIGLAFVVVPLQVGARSVAFPRLAAASFWGWLMGAALYIAAYAMNGGPGGGRTAGVNLWITAVGLLTVSVVAAAISLATTVLALRAPGLTIDRTPLYAWSVAVAAVMWIVSLPVLFAELVLMYVDHRHGGRSIGANGTLFNGLGWFLKNPQIYLVAVPVLGFTADVIATTARARLELRFVAQGAIAAFGVFGFGAYLVTETEVGYKSVFTMVLGLVAVLPILGVLAASADAFRRGSLRVTAGLLYAIAATVTLLISVAAGALGSIPNLKTMDTIYDLGVSHGVVIAAVIASIGGVHWWATKVLGNTAKEGPAMLAPLLMLVGGLAIVVPDLVSGLVGKGAELAPDYTGGIKPLAWIIVAGVGVLALGILAALAAILPALKSADDVPADPFEGQTLEWLAPSPPPLENFAADLPVVASAEPLVDLREES